MGPLLFLVYINDIDEGVTSGLLIFADDTIVFGVIASQEDIQKLQDDLKNLCRWSRTGICNLMGANAMLCFNQLKSTQLNVTCLQTTANIQGT